MITNHNGQQYLELPFYVGEKVYICATVDWDLGFVEGEITDMEAYWSDYAQDFYWRIYVEHEFIHSEKNPVLIINRYVFCEEEVAKTIEEAKQKKQNRALQIEARRKVNRGVNVYEFK